MHGVPRRGRAENNMPERWEKLPASIKQA